MPISDKRLAANRANAKKSTGPRTPKGKAVCAMNGFQHGFTGLAVVTTDEDRESQTAFIHPYVQRLTGPLYGGLSLKALEENVLACGELGPIGEKIETEHARVHHALAQSQVFVVNQSSSNNLSLYDQRITRNIHKNLKLLREEQALRKAEELLEAKAKPLTRTVSTTNEENGFGFANALSPTEEAPIAPPQAAKRTHHHIEMPHLCSSEFIGG